MFNLYVLVHPLEKKECWHAVYDFMESISPLNIIIGRDLNLVFDSKEKRGGNFSRHQLRPFVEDLIKLWNIIDFKPKKGLYTWTNNRTGTAHILACFDRFLVHSSFLLDKKLVSSKILPKLTSDHGCGRKLGLDSVLFQPSVD